MTEVRQVYKCEICGNIVEVLHKGAGTLVCCNKPMTLREENTVDASKEKHVPVVELVDGGVLVKVGSVEHPMEEKHYIEWIEVHTKDKVYRRFLNPGDKPEAFFKLNDGEEVLFAREYCNLHGLWKA
ncbi:MAG: desulfoferrodoxin [Caloramator sp.]|uniref:Desulfoferrodoxin n=1 Tax=Caloramator proteoclasticus DSM 10124 TaxID=1121262 RepID=A0A1M4TS34_9CLOT|nr:MULTISPECIES: desulfoferrodoxin [Caloramator]MBZ4662883.1 desulfoferrodoxin [Caloramator sp.]SHE47300.1 superoxide reductase [Caloramator proteoclasticus DSM 10124]